MPILPLLAWLVLAQAPAAAPQRLTSSSELVVLNVTVLEKKAHVSGLPREAFAILEDGKPQPLGFFENADLPSTVGLVIDSSISMHRRREAVIAAGSSFAESSHPDDELFTINFNERVWPGLPDGRMFTSDRDELRRALASIGARGQTAFYDGVSTALRHLEKGSRQKKVLVVVSDGGDNVSRTTFEEVLQAALKMDAVIYTVSIRDEYDSEGRPDVLKKLAAATGGEAFFLRHSREVAPAFQRIARDIRSGYTLGYTPEPGRSGYRAVKVLVQSSNRNLTVRCRSGYQR
jgi:Ca-activated chloride channel homolog